MMMKLSLSKRNTRVPLFTKLLNSTLPGIEFTKEEPTNNGLPYPPTERKLKPSLISTSTVTIELATNAVIAQYAMNRLHCADALVGFI